MRDRSNEKSVSISNDVYFAIKEIAKNERRTIKETVSIILEEYIDRYKTNNKNEM